MSKITQIGRFKDVGNRMQWPRMISQAKNRVVGLLTLSLGGATLCYKFNQ